MSFQKQYDSSFQKIPEFSIIKLVQTLTIMPEDMTLTLELQSRIYFKWREG